MQNTSDARSWDMEKARLVGVISRLHVTIDGLLAANRELSSANQELLNANRAALQDLAEIYQMSQPSQPSGAMADIHRKSSPPPQSAPRQPTDESAA